MAQIIWAPSALDDVESIAEYIARDSVELASLFVSRLSNATDRLQEFPFSGRIIPEINNPDCRVVVYGAYRIMYQGEGKEVWIQELFTEPVIGSPSNQVHPGRRGGVTPLMHMSSLKPL